MPLTATDWIVIVGYLLVNLLISMYYRRRSSGNTEEFFVSGRDVSWWLGRYFHGRHDFRRRHSIVGMRLGGQVGHRRQLDLVGPVRWRHVDGIFLCPLLATGGDSDRRAVCRDSL